MNSTKRWDCLFQGVDRVMVVILGLLVVSLGLWAYGQLQGPWDAAGRIVAMFVASWVGVVALLGSAGIPVLLFVRASTTCR